MNAAVVKAGLALAGLAASLHWVVEGGGFSSNVVLLNSRNWYAYRIELTCTNQSLQIVSIPHISFLPIDRRKEVEESGHAVFVNVW